MKPSIALETNREKIRRIASTFRVDNLRVFGSVLHGYDKDGSDLDLLVDPLPGTTLFDLGGLQSNWKNHLAFKSMLAPQTICLASFKNRF